MNIFFQYYKFLNSLSLDIAFGAMVSSWYLSRVLDVEPSWVAYLILSITVWCIYTFDHLLDAKKNDGVLSLRRHLFHRRYSSILSKLVIFALATNGILVFYLPFSTLTLGAFLGCVVLAYFVSIHMMNWKFIVYKEHVIAIIYTFGIMVGPFSLLEGGINLHQILILIAFFLIVLLNVLIFAFYDFEADKRAGFPSLIQAMGIHRAQSFIKIISMVAVGVLSFIFWLGFHDEGLMLFLMFAVLQVLFFFNDLQIFRNSYRFLGDGIFLLPLIYICEKQF